MEVGVPKPYKNQGNHDAKDCDNGEFSHDNLSGLIRPVFPFWQDIVLGVTPIASAFGHDHDILVWIVWSDANELPPIFCRYGLVSLRTEPCLSGCSVGNGEVLVTKRIGLGRRKLLDGPGISKTLNISADADAVGQEYRVSESAERVKEFGFQWT